MKLNPDVFKRAAIRIADGKNGLCCPAICGARRHLYWHGDEYVVFFTELFRPKAFSLEWFGPPFIPSNQGQRILALLFAAEVARDMNRSSK